MADPATSVMKELTETKNNNVILMLVPTMMTVAAEEMVEGHGCATVKKRLMTMVGVLCGCVQKRIREELGE